ncbi:MAG: TIGR03936 family radical SAM-associated protein [Lachnospiraceae bacterium]|nr:TIGR03936 family radical SAM-associated protein [Lachnospiraceae bacterium]
MSYKVRIKFNKYDHMVFIGHLDLMRYFQKAFRRSGIDICYTTGFSPHQVISFAQPLGVGVYSNGEYVDISVESEPDTEQIKSALQGVMVEGVDILSVISLPDNAPTSMASVMAADYTVRFRKEYVPAFDVAKAAPDFMAQQQIMITKETKKGSRELDLKEHIYDLKMTDGRSSAKRDLLNKCDGPAIYMMLDASSGGNIKPGLVMQEIFKFAGQTLGNFDLIVTREDLYAEKEMGGQKEYISLGDIRSV